jgi:pimeloyl-ACP methyl ester carboxylesterase
MAIAATDAKYVHANGIDIHYVEAGQGEPLLLLHGGIVSTSPVWSGHPFAYVSHMEAFAEHFRVIAPETRGIGRTVHPGGSVPYTQLADDIAALIEALGLDQPMICGFSDGAQTASILGIRAPGSVRAIVNDAGYDLFNPQAPTSAMMRQALGGGPEATRADPAAAKRFFDQSNEMRATFALMKSDNDGAQGPGHWRTVIAETFERLTSPTGYTLEDLRETAAPTLILAGDRDQFCSVDEGATAYRMLSHGELAILPNHGHVITPAAVEVTIDFLRRHAAL